jgi:hypothetical protein
MARRPGLLSPFAYVRRAGFYKGLLGGNRGWLVLGGLFYGGRKLKTTFGRTEEVAAVETLKPGEFVTIRTIVPPSRRQKKSAKRAAKASKR